MKACISNGSFQTFRFVQYPAAQIIPLINFADFSHKFQVVTSDAFLFFKRFFSIPEFEGSVQYPSEGYSRSFRYQFRQGIGFCQGKVHHSCNVFYAHPCSHRSISNNLGYLISAIFFYNVVNYLLAAFIVKISVNIGH